MHKQTKPLTRASEGSWYIHPILLQGSMIPIQTVKTAARHYITSRVCTRMRSAVLHFAENHCPPDEVLSAEHQERCKTLINRICGDLEEAASLMYDEFMALIAATEKTRLSTQRVRLTPSPLVGATKALVVTQCSFLTKSHSFFLHFITTAKKLLTT